MTRAGIRMLTLNLIALLMWITLPAFAEPFDIVQNSKGVPLLADQKDSEVVGIACKALTEDIERIEI